MTVILNGTYQAKPSDQSNRLITGLWFLVCTLLMSLFGGELRDKVLEPDPTKRVDSYHDLYEWKGVTIEGHNSTDIVQFAKNFNSSMALDFRSRIKSTTLDILNLDKNGTVDESYLKITAIRNGDMVIAYPYTMLQAIKLYLIFKGMKEEIDFHISKEADIPMAYYTLVTNDSILHNWNLV